MGLDLVGGPIRLDAIMVKRPVLHCESVLFDEPRAPIDNRRATPSLAMNME